MLRGNMRMWDQTCDKTKAEDNSIDDYGYCDGGGGGDNNTDATVEDTDNDVHR